MSCHGRRLGFDLIETELASFDPPTPRTLIRIEQNMKWIGWPVAEIWPFEIRHITRGALGTPIFMRDSIRL